MKYRYMSSGSFTPKKYEYHCDGADQRFLCVDIPSPYLHDSEGEAMKDEQFAYRFVADEGGVRIAVYPAEDFKVDMDENGKKCLKTWVVGQPFHYYDYEEFKALGGKIYEMPAACAKWESSDYETDVSFNELFPDLTSKDKPIYIDNEAYFIAEEE